jgi:enamine deaminase RidA (YjgF/YER057c/UK114 family)
MDKQLVAAEGIYAAKGYSHAIRTGPIVWTAGLVAHGPDGQIVGKGDIRAQVDQVYDNLRAVLDAHGLGFADVIKITMFTTSVLFRPAIMEARARHFPTSPPVSTFFVVTSLSTADQLFEMEAVALARE